MDVINKYVGDDPEQNAVLIVRATAMQFALSFFTSIARSSDANAALALLGLYGAFYRKKDPIKLYFVFLLLSLLMDFIWMIMFGHQISGMEYEAANMDGNAPLPYPSVAAAKFVMTMSVVQFIVKAISVPFVFKLFNFLPDEEDFFKSSSSAAAAALFDSKLSPSSTSSDRGADSLPVPSSSSSAVLESGMGGVARVKKQVRQRGQEVGYQGGYQAESGDEM